MSMLPSRKITAAFIGVFLIGAIVGGLVIMDYTDTRLSRFLNHTGDPESMAARINQKYRNDYKLSSEEQSRIAPLVKEMTRQLYQERRQFGTNVINTLDEYHQKIAEQMTPEQREVYAKVNEDRKKRMSTLLLDQAPTTPGQK
jgi:hypothetical protein